MNTDTLPLRSLDLVDASDDPWTRPAPVVVIGGSAMNRDAVAAEAAARLGVDVARLLARRKAGSAAGDVTPVDLDLDDRETLVWLGLGDGSPTEARLAGAALARAVDRPALCLPTAGLSAEGAAAFAQGWLLAGYRYSLRSTPDEPKGALTMAVVESVDATARLTHARAVAEGVRLARDVGNTPSSVKSPDWLAERAHSLASGTPLRVRVLGERELRRGEFGGILAVGQGSSHEPRLVVLESPGARGARHTVLVGKGITFDSGGLSLKAADAMATMKTDMAGAAAVLGTMAVLAASGSTDRVTAVLALAENMPSGSAYRPGDVVRHFGGGTSEIVNTDAEGRIVLADALSYAVAALNPDVIVDVATLTGAATLGLSRNYGALFANDEALLEELRAAGDGSDDSVWPLPLTPDYRPVLDSDIADIAQAPRAPGVGAGAIVAALFLSHFVGDRRWAHLDIAGPARSDADRGDISAGATGFGVRLLSRWLACHPDDQKG
jgi:leucyl aminopeptidase